ncbi:VanZ family protein [Trichloromonas sp.]|uniref:VanZ family protein n=1 Tax=Trichloromonas sp. TaxID=3069249 RepID=UPI002A3EDD6C|nr:VanZ family protein [Trichloromonas sp.]
MTSLPAPRKPLTALVLIYGALLLYASLMPYDFTGVMDGRQLWRGEFWNHWPFNPQARISGSDVVSNLVLYAPLGLLLAVRGRFSRLGAPTVFLFSTLFCSLLSLGVETLQGMTLSRTPSAADWLLNTLSGMAGALCGTLRGKTAWERLHGWLVNRWRERPLDILTLIIAGLLVADALSPFLPTILLSQVWRNLKNAHFDLFAGLAQHPWHWWLVTRTLAYLILTCLLAAWGGGATRIRSWWRAALLAVALAVGLELLKPLIVSRILNLANVATSTGGVLAALWVGPLLAPRLSHRRKLELGILALLAYGFYLAWTPFNFILDGELLRQKLPRPVELLPFYHYAMGASLNHARLFVQAIAVNGILVYLLRVRFPDFDGSRRRLILAVLLTGLIGFFQEGGQLFLPRRTPSMTDVYCFMIGGALGAWISRPPRPSKDKP